VDAREDVEAAIALIRCNHTVSLVVTVTLYIFLYHFEYELGDGL